jgi:hypothetical protein
MPVEPTAIPSEENLVLPLDGSGREEASNDKTPQSCEQSL